MYKKWDAKFNTYVVTIFVGEYYVTNRPEVLSTVLGSCISVCLFDEINGIAGFNHFMLPEDSSNKEKLHLSDETIHQEDLLKQSMRYGLHAMEILIAEMQKIGASRQHLKAKVFGGGNVLRNKRLSESIGDRNIGFARAFLKFEGIPIENENVGKSHGRKIFFLAGPNRVFVKKIEIEAEIRHEKEYLEKLKHLKREERSFIF
jgi:chemotaxis protein CheD